MLLRNPRLCNATVRSLRSKGFGVPTVLLSPRTAGGEEGATMTAEDFEAALATACPPPAPCVLLVDCSLAVSLIKQARPAAYLFLPVSPPWQPVPRSLPGGFCPV